MNSKKSVVDNASTRPKLNMVAFVLEFVVLCSVIDGTNILVARLTFSGLISVRD